MLRCERTSELHCGFERICMIECMLLELVLRCSGARCVCVFTYNLCWLNFALHWTNIDKLQLMDSHTRIFEGARARVYGASCLSALSFSPTTNDMKCQIEQTSNALRIVVCLPHTSIDDKCAVWLSDGASLIQYQCERYTASSSVPSHVPIAMLSTKRQKNNSKTHSSLAIWWMNDDIYFQFRWQWRKLCARAKKKKTKNKFKYKNHSALGNSQSHQPAQEQLRLSVGSFAVCVAAEASENLRVLWY